MHVVTSGDQPLSQISSWHQQWFVSSHYVY